MKVYKKLMGFVLMIENIVLTLSLAFVTILTFGNVVARKGFNHAFGFTEELTVAFFVLISLLAAGVAARTGDLVNLGLVPDLVGPKGKKVLNVISNVICIAYSVIMLIEGWKVMAKDVTISPILHIPMVYFKAFVVIGAVSLILHFIENMIDYCSADLTKKEED